MVLLFIVHGVSHVSEVTCHVAEKNAEWLWFLYFLQFYVRMFVYMHVLLISLNKSVYAPPTPDNQELEYIN